MYYQQNLEMKGLKSEMENLKNNKEDSDKTLFDENYQLNKEILSEETIQKIEAKEEEVQERNNLLKVTTALLAYMGEHSGYFPSSLEQLNNLDSSLQDDIRNYYYAVSKDKEHFHIGVELKTTMVEEFLTQDNDFNSVSAGYENGFDGKDPIYDIKN